MHYYWLHDKQNQKSFDFYWDTADNNRYKDYFSKHHTAKYHTEICPSFVQDKQLCAFSLTSTI